MLWSFAAGAFAQTAPAFEIDIPAGTEVLVLGEVHDNPVHHENQARAVAALAPGALVFEMLTPAQATRILPDIRRDQTALNDALGWDQSGWPPFSYYFPIFAAAPAAAVFGGDVPRTEIRRATETGAAAAMGDAAPLFGLDRPLEPAEQAQREQLQQDAHCGALPSDSLPGMVEAQRLRDAALARAVIAAMAETGGPVAVITGNGHARADWGMPRALRRAMPGLAVLSVGQYEETAPDRAPFDLVLTTPAVERGDPCAAFR